MNTQKQYWILKRVFVTGATGMIGAWLVKELIELEAYVVVLIRDADPQSELYRSGDIANVSVVNGQLEDEQVIERAINEHEIDTVIHLGAQTIVGVAHRSPWMTFEANVKGTYNILEACRKHNALVKRVVIASSDKAYGASDELPYVEDHPLQGRYPYEVSKSAADLITQSYYHTYDLPVAIARCGNVFGGGDLNWSRIVPGTIRSLIDHQAPIIRSDGEYVRDYIFVKDVVQAYLTLAQALDDKSVWGEAYNFSNENPLTVLELVKLITNEMGDAYQQFEPVIENSAVGEIRDQYLSARKANEQLGWQVKFSLAEGLKETADWYRAYFEVSE